MPKNLKEELLFTGMMAGMMVLVMSLYNVMRVDGVNSGAVVEALVGFPLGLVVAGILDLALVGPVVKGIVFKYLIKDPENTAPIRIALTISTLMVLGMVSFMTAYGLVMTGHIGWPQYFAGWLINIVVALPLQLLVVGPVARAGLTRIQN